MKYWRGYLTAAILAVITVGLMQIAQRYTALVDTFYPYLTRTLQNFLAEWSGAMSVNLWQIGLVLALVVALATVVLMILLRWNFVQWLGWVLACVSLVCMLHTGIYGLNVYAGPLAEDLRMDAAEFSEEDLEDATIYFRDQANALALQMSRDEESNLSFDDFEDLALQAGEGFSTMVYDDYFSVFAGTTTPVKELSWADLFTSVGVTGVFVPLTGEASVNPQIPAVAQPFAMCYQMSRRMCIALECDASFSAFLACQANDSPQFRYSACFMAYRYCINALDATGTDSASAAAARIRSGVNTYLYYDLQNYEKFFTANQNRDRMDALDAVRIFYMERTGTEYYDESAVAVLLVNWYIQEEVLPYLDQEEITGFDPMDETQVDISDLIK